MIAYASCFLRLINILVYKYLKLFDINNFNWIFLLHTFVIVKCFQTPISVSVFSDVCGALHAIDDKLENGLDPLSLFCRIANKYNNRPICFFLGSITFEKHPIYSSKVNLLNHPDHKPWRPIFIHYNDSNETNFGLAISFLYPIQYQSFLSRVPLLQNRIVKSNTILDSNTLTSYKMII